jgi:hypothetical protein
MSWSFSSRWSVTDNSHIDPERLAALLDGRLSETEAAVLRAELASADDDTIAAFADAIALTAEDAKARPRAMGRTRRWTWSLSALAAAAAITVVVFSLRSGLAADDYSPQSLSRALGAGVGIRPSAWSVMRGDAQDLPPLARAVRLGALLTDLEVEAQTDQAVRSVAKDIVTLLEGANGGSLATPPYAGLANGRTATLGESQRAEAGRQAMRFVDHSFVRGGAYLEALRLAMLADDRAFFERTKSDALDAMAADARISANDRVRLTQLTTVLRTRPINARDAGEKAEELLRLLAR